MKTSIDAQVESFSQKKNEGKSVCVYYCRKLFALGKGAVEDMCYERRRAEACVN